jgi:hypothetical protein
MNETDTTNDSAMQVLMNKATQAWWRCEAAVETIKASAERLEQRIKAFMESTPEKPGTHIARDAPHTDNSVRGAERGNVNINRVEVGERTWAVIAIMLATLAIGLAILAVVLSQQSEREARLAQYDLQILRAKVEAAGIKTDDH